MTGQGRPVMLWLAGAAFAMIAGLLVAISLAGVSDIVVAGVGAAAITGAVSIVLALISLQDRQREADEREQMQRRSEQERTRSRHEEHVIRALDYFTGHTQRRNVGIAIVEGYWHTAPDLRGVLVPLLVNQAVYLLEESNQADAVHEADNCRRIVDLLLRLDAGSISPDLMDYYRVLLRSVERRCGQQAAASTARRGVEIRPEILARG